MPGLTASKPSSPPRVRPASPRPALGRRQRPSVTICLLTFADHPALAWQALDSIERFCRREDFRVIVGANEVGAETAACLEKGESGGQIDRVLWAPRNSDKCPMMRRMLDAVETELVWWFDDDSYPTASSALDEWMSAARAAPTDTVQWGQLASCDSASEFTDLADPVGFVRAASWYRGLPPPSWRPGGKGEFDYDGMGSGDGRWFFLLGGCWLMRTSALRQLDWPDRRLIRLGDDVFLGEAIRQQGWTMGNIGTPGIAINTAPRRARAARAGDESRNVRPQ